MIPWQSVERINWVWLLLGVAILCSAPLVTEIPPTDLVIFALLALSLGLMWGYAGVLSLGHAAYFGLGAYAYAVGVINIGESTLPFLLAMLIPAIVAAAFGAMAMMRLATVGTRFAPPLPSPPGPSVPRASPGPHATAMNAADSATPITVDETGSVALTRFEMPTIVRSEGRNAKEVRLNRAATVRERTRNPTYGPSRTD